MPFGNTQPSEPPFAPDLSVIDIAAWLRVRDENWMDDVAFDFDDDTFLIEEDAA